MKAMALVAIVLCQACSSEFIAKTIYNNLDDSYADSINDYARFDKAQRQLINKAADDFAVWHRSTQLEQYQTALGDLRQMLNAPVSSEQIRSLGTQMESFGEQMSNYAWPALIPLLRTVSNEQITSIESSLAEELSEWEKESQERYLEDSGEMNAKASKKEIRKMFRRTFSVKLRNSQLNEFVPMLDSSRELEIVAIELERNWNQQFIALLQQQTSAPVEDRVMDHMRAGSRLLRDNYPEQVESSTRRFCDALSAVFNSLDEDQRGSMQARLSSYYQLLQVLIDDPRGNTGLSE